jgi:hypothetical protein
MSIRETENEVNLLVPGAGLFEPTLGQPLDKAEDDEVTDADELGDGRND